MNSLAEDEIPGTKMGNDFVLLVEVLNSIFLEFHIESKARTKRSLENH